MKRNNRQPKTYSNTQYGRRKSLEAARAFNKTLTPKELAEGKRFAYLLVAGIFIIFALLILLFFGVDGLTNWLTPKGIK